MGCCCGGSAFFTEGIHEEGFFSNGVVPLLFEVVVAVVDVAAVVVEGVEVSVGELEAALLVELLSSLFVPWTTPDSEIWMLREEAEDCRLLLFGVKSSIEDKSRRNRSVRSEGNKRGKESVSGKRTDVGREQLIFIDQI